MGFGGTFDLCDFYQGLIANALHGIFIVDGITRPILQLKHMTIRFVGVMWDSE